MSMDNQQEIFPIVDEAGQVTGSATRGECHSGSKLLHPVVHLHVFNSKGEVYLQRRPEWKDIQPGKWDTAVGGHIDYGETPEVALCREVREELGITDFQPEFVDKYVFESKRERELGRRAFLDDAGDSRGNGAGDTDAQFRERVQKMLWKFNHNKLLR